MAESETINDDNILKRAINNTINNYYIYGTIILLFMIVIFLTYSINNLNNIENQMATIENNNLRPLPAPKKSILDDLFGGFFNFIFVQKNLQQIMILVIYFILTMIFLFLYNRERVFGNLNLFSSTQEKIKSEMGEPISNLISKIGYVCGSIGLIVIIIIFVLWIYNSFSKLQKLLNFILGILSLIIILALIYFIFKEKFDKLINSKIDNLNFIDRILKIISQFIFLIPCLILILLDVVKHQFKITTPTIWIILFIEIIIICLYFFIPFLFNKLNSHDGKMLLEGPVFINKRRMIGTYQNVEKNDFFKKKIEEKFKFSLFKNISNNNTFNTSKNDFTNKEAPPFNITIDFAANNSSPSNFNYESITEINPDASLSNYNYVPKIGIPKIGKEKIQRGIEQRFNFNYNYAVSLFIYLNRQPINTSYAYVIDTTIFDYASKPKIVYNGLEEQLKFICTDINNLEKTIYSTNDIKYQKWMHIVVNYRSGIVDIFIDGNLRATENNIQPYMDYSKIYVGSNDGIAGGIKNVMYFKEPLTLNKIKYINNFM